MAAMDPSVALFLSSLLVAAGALTGAVDFIVKDTAIGTPGSNRFEREMGIDYTKQVLSNASSFIWKTFKQHSEADRKRVKQVTLTVETMGGIAYTEGDAIHLSANYVAKIPGDVKMEIEGVLYHETTHVWQWDGKGNANGGLIEGVADYVRLKAGYAPDHWVKAGGGKRWDQGYDVTAWFLDYCNRLKHGFVADLNLKMKDGYSDSFFKDLLGKTVEQLWKDYKAKYGS